MPTSTPNPAGDSTAGGAPAPNPIYFVVNGAGGRRLFHRPDPAEVAHWAVNAHQHDPEDPAAPWFDDADEPIEIVGDPAGMTGYSYDIDGCLVPATPTGMAPVRPFGQTGPRMWVEVGAGGFRLMREDDEHGPAYEILPDGTPAHEDEYTAAGEGAADVGPDIAAAIEAARGVIADLGQLGMRIIDAARTFGLGMAGLVQRYEDAVARDAAVTKATMAEIAASRGDVQQAAAEAAQRAASRPGQVRVLFPGLAEMFPSLAEMFPSLAETGGPLYHAAVHPGGPHGACPMRECAAWLANRTGQGTTSANGLPLFASSDPLNVWPAPEDPGPSTAAGAAYSEHCQQHARAAQLAGAVPAFVTCNRAPCTGVPPVERRKYVTWLADGQAATDPRRG